MMKRLNLVKQEKGSKDCVAACIAMLINSSISEVKSKLPVEFNGCLYETLQVLCSFKILHVSYATPLMLSGRLYLITVPGLNAPKSNHAILVDCRDGVVVYDPSPNETYTDVDAIEGLIPYSEVVEIILD